MDRSSFFKSLFGLALFRQPVGGESEWKCLYCHEPWHDKEQVPPLEKSFMKGNHFGRVDTVDTAIAFQLYDKEPIMEFPGDDRCEFCGCAIRIKAR